MIMKLVSNLNYPCCLINLIHKKARKQESYSSQRLENKKYLYHFVVYMPTYKTIYIISRVPKKFTPTRNIIVGFARNSIFYLPSNLLMR